MSSIILQTAETVLSKTVEKQFYFLKNSYSYQDLLIKGMQLSNSMGWLVPVSYFHCDDALTIELLAKWRAANDFAFPTRFEVTIDGTAKWLKKRLLDVTVETPLAEKQEAVKERIALCRRIEDALRAAETDNGASPGGGK